MPEKKKLPVPAILLSLFGFVLLWAVVTDAWEYSSRLSIPYGSYIYAYLSRLVWVLPAVWLIIRYSASLRFSRKELFSRPVWNRPLLAVLAVSLAVNLAWMFVMHGGFWFNTSVVLPLEALKFILVGFVEETVFRGWGYNALSKAATERKAVIYSTVFFILLHSPAYFIRLFRTGAMDYTAWLMQSLTALICGIVCCWLMKKGKNIWNPIIAHVVYDICNVLLVG